MEAFAVENRPTSETILSALVEFVSKEANVSRLSCQQIKQIMLSGGTANNLIERLDFIFTGAEGVQRTRSFVRKDCFRAEVAALRLARKMSDPSGLPSVVIDWTDDERPNDLQANGLIMPFYSGKTLDFGDHVPGKVLRTLAQIHARRFDTSEMDLAWHYTGEYFKNRVERVGHVFANSDTFTQNCQMRDGYVRRFNKLDLSELASITDSLPKSLVHGDMQPGHIVLDQIGNAYIIDWEALALLHRCST